MKAQRNEVLRAMVTSICSILLLIFLCLSERNSINSYNYNLLKWLYDMKEKNEVLRAITAWICSILFFIFFLMFLCFEKYNYFLF